MTQKQSFEKTGKLYAVYPDYWKEKWGEKPLLGHVRASDSFYAVRKAYDLGIVRVNFTFQPEVVEVETYQKREFRKRRH